jgi:hypothetical protein
MKTADQQRMSGFSAALECESETERTAYLDQLRHKEPGLWQRVQTQLRAHDEAGRFLEPIRDDSPRLTTSDQATTAALLPSPTSGPLWPFAR